MKNDFNELISRFVMAEERISETEDQISQQKLPKVKSKEKKENPENTKELRDDCKKYSICAIGIPEEREWSRRNIDAIMAKRFPKLMTDIKAQIQEAQRT